MQSILSNQQIYQIYQIYRNNRTTVVY